MKKAFALFDFDGTLIKGDSIVRFMLYLRKRGLCGTGRLALAGAAAAAYYGRLISAERAKTAAMRALAGRGTDEMALLAEQFCRDELLPLMYPEGLEEIRRRQTEGAEVVLLTASPALYLEPFKAWLGLSRIVGTRMALNAHGAYTGCLEGANCRGAEKVRRLNEVLALSGDSLDFARSSAYGDSASDLPMLMLCDERIAVNPKNKLLKHLKGCPGATVVHWG